MKTILKKNYEFMVDDDIFNQIKDCQFYVIEQKDKSPYLCFRKAGSKKRQRVSRFVVNCPEYKIVDHINRNTLDNRRENLRICTYSENNINRKTKSSSGYRGVYQEGLHNKWRVQIHFRGNSMRIGGFKTKERAAVAYNNIASRMYGKFAVLNPVVVSDYERSHL